MVSFLCSVDCASHLVLFRAAAVTVSLLAFCGFCCCERSGKPVDLRNVWKRFEFFQAA